MSFEDLRAFLMVAEHGSFLSAAVSLGVSRTTLRRQVDALEAKAGVPLLQRDSKGVVLTEAGRRLLGGGREMEQGFSALLNAVRETGRRPEGEVRIMLQLGLPPPAMGALFAMFRASWPDVRMRTRFHESPLTVPLSDLDLVAWFGESDPGAAWKTYSFITVRQRLFASAQYLSEHGTPTSIEDLRKHEILAWVTPEEPEPAIVTISGSTHPITAILTSTNVDWLHECARMGLGLGWAPDADLPPSPGQEPLIPVMEDQVGANVEIRVAVPRAMAEVPKVRVFIESLQSMRDIVTDS